MTLPKSQNLNEFVDAVKKTGEIKVTVIPYSHMKGREYHYRYGVVAGETSLELSDIGVRLEGSSQTLEAELEEAGISVLLKATKTAEQLVKAGLEVTIKAIAEDNLHYKIIESARQQGWVSP